MSTNRPPLSDSTVAVVMPLLNEVAVIRSLVAQVTGVLDRVGCRWNVILVNDGSTDGSTELLNLMADAEPRITVLHLSRNFGHQAAVHAGLCHATADAVVLMDSDAQDDPQALAEMIQLWQEGQDVVYAVRFARKENLLKRMAFSTFHRLLGSISSVDIPRDAGNFGLLDSRVVREVISLGEVDRYFPGLRTWVGFNQCALPVERLKRHDDNPRVSFRGLISLAKTAMFSFSRVPLLAFYGLAMFSAMIGIACFCWAVYHKLFTDAAIPGWASITTLSAFFGTINALGIAIMGEYVTRIYDQVRNRPGFVVQHSRNVEFNTNERRRSTPEFVPSQISMTNSELKAHESAALASDSRLLEDIQALLDDVARTRSESPRTDKNIFPAVTPGGFASGTSNSLNR
jgi:glycosyltransferase involved in cell wall biosynthesis